MATEPTEALQDIRFARSADGVNIAYAVHGSGPAAADRRLLAEPPAVRLAEPSLARTTWSSSAGSPPSSATTSAGTGLSDRGVTDHSLEARTADLEAVADDAGFDRFALLAMSQGGPVALEYASGTPSG